MDFVKTLEMTQIAGVDGSCSLHHYDACVRKSKWDSTPIFITFKVLSLKHIKTFFFKGRVRL